MPVQQHRFKAYLGVILVIGFLPGVVHGGLFTSVSNATYNVGPEAAWFNPAGMTGVKTTAVSAGVGGLIPVYEFDTEIAGAGGGNGGNSGVASVLPTVFAVTPVGDRFRLGFSAYAPLGGPDGFGWDFGSDFSGRYAVQSITLASMGLAASGAFKVNDQFSVGVGAAAQWLEINQSTALNTPFAGDGRAELKDLDDWDSLFYAGLLYQVTPRTSVGVVYRSEWEPSLKGDLVFSGLPITLPTVDFELDLTFPQWVQVGVQHAISESWIMSLSFDWQDWSEFNDVVVNLAFANGRGVSATADPNWHDVYSAGFTLTHVIGPNLINASLVYFSSPVDDDDRVINLAIDESLTFSLGVAHHTKTATYALGAAAAFSGDAEVDQVAQGVRFAGEFDTNITVVLGGSAEWRF